MDYRGYSLGQDPDCVTISAHGEVVETVSTMESAMETVDQWLDAR